MKEEKTTLIIPKKKKKSDNDSKDWLNPLVMFIMGIILTFSADKFIILICYFLGVMAIIMGIYNLFTYYNYKKKFNFDNNHNLVIGSLAIFIGIIIVILASAIEVGIRYIIGFTLIYNGLKKLSLSLSLKDFVNITESIIFLVLGLYTILAENIVFSIIGILLIVASILDFLKLYHSKK